MAHGTLRAYQDELRSQWQADWENWQNVGQWRGFVGGGGQRLTSTPRTVPPAATATATT